MIFKCASLETLFCVQQRTKSLIAEVV